MERYFTKTFYRFFFTFIIILMVAFGVMIVVGNAMPVVPHGIDNTAAPK
jgi:hypothetical protein